MIEEQEHLSDESDKATRREVEFLAIALSNVLRQEPLNPTGFCLAPDCGEQLVTDSQLKHGQKHGFPAGTQRFCNVECRNAFDRHEKARRLR